MLLVFQQCHWTPELQVGGLKVRQSLACHPVSEQRAYTELSFCGGATMAVSGRMESRAESRSLPKPSEE